ncbi:hypothetical protein TNCV_2695601 [Trichonephila clavipes]|nr:hypothetical protein TNCV_2695601 [Trichonephila clavipes]
MAPVELHVCPYTIKRNLYYSTMGHGSGEIFYFGGGIPQIFFIPTSSKDERQSRDTQGAIDKMLRDGSHLSPGRVEAYCRLGSGNFRNPGNSIF